LKIEIKEWSVRDELKMTETGFGENGSLATDTFDAIVSKARDTGTGGAFSLKISGDVVKSVSIPPGK